MSAPLRTRAIALDRDFEVIGQIAKTRVDAATGERYITGLASGLAEDRDGERVSANAIKKMVAQPVDDLALTSSHDQDWLTEIGTVTKHWHDPEHDELWVETKLPPDGEDPIADKAWRATQKHPLGFSIGGKLRNAFREIVNENGVTKQRKVLDDIWLRHYCLTKKPAYAGSFAEAVAKTWDGPDAGEDDFTELEDGVVFDRTAEIRKAAKDDKPAKPGREAEDPTDDTPGEDDPPAGTATDGPGKGGDDEAPDSDAKTDQQAADALPMAKRHLSCPHCGHEFAAPLSADETGNRQPDADADEPVGETTKTTKDMSATAPNISDALERVRALADVAKTAGATDEAAEAAAAAAAEVAKTDADELTLPEVAKALQAVDANVTDVVAKTAEALTGLTELVQGLVTQVSELPTGRKSTGRVLSTRDEVTKTDDELDSVEKVRKAIADEPDPVRTLELINEAKRRGIQL